MKLSKVILYILLPLTIILSASTYTSDRFEIVKNLDIFSDVFEKVNALYVDEPQAGELMQKGIDAMLRSLDPYTVYYPESEIEDYKFMTTGQYGGIGARIRKIDEFVVVSEPYEGSPAEKSGLKAGDIILEVDGKNVTGKSTSDLSKVLKGAPGSKVKLLIDRPGTESKIEVELTRKEIKVSSVPYHSMLTEEIGYIKMTSFTQNVSQEVKEAFNDLKRNNNMTKLVFDLRGNPGGLLNEAVNVVNMFVSKNVTVVETRGRVEAWNKNYSTLNNPTDSDIPVVILVNGSSASASEIVSGSLQDLDRAVVIGADTYGKGLVQTTRNLKYNSSIKVTTAKYYIPSGRCIQAIDYQNKDDKGRATKIPDSLFKMYNTANGREVLDGHGIKPDIFVDEEEYNNLVRSLVTGDHIFNFATQFTLQNDSITSADKFEISDQVFNDFVTFLEKEGYSYESDSDERM
jgi:carboxyl-terminal processing protease